MASVGTDIVVITLRVLLWGDLTRSVRTTILDSRLRGNDEAHIVRHSLTYLYWIPVCTGMTVSVLRRPPIVDLRR